MWSPQQEAALVKVERWLKNPKRQVFRLFGYAGSGKTELAREIGGNYRTRFATFTGKAAELMRQRGCDPVRTIHSLIYQTTYDEESGRYHYQLHPRSEFDDVELIVIDECSMVGHLLMLHLLSFGIPTLAVGDPAQLPSPDGEGGFMLDKPDVLLTEIHRQARGNPILRLAESIRRGQRLPPLGVYDDALQITNHEDFDGHDVVLVGANDTRRFRNRIAAALSDKSTITSAALAALFGEVETAIAEVETDAADAKARALDPTIDDPAAARQHRDDCRFRLERFKAALPPLQQRCNEVRLAERKAKWRADYADVKTKRDDAATSLKDIYAEFTTKLINVLIAARQVDEEAARVNRTAPDGEHDRLLTVECAARQVNAVADDFSLMNIKLPTFNQPNAWSWPPPKPPTDFRMLVPPALLHHPGDNWAAHQKEAKMYADAEAKRVADYYRNQTREREERDNAEARAAQARRQAST
jgi:hypothetical protein